MAEIPSITITTHDGQFHADEVLSIVILKKIFNSATIVRTRDPYIIEQSDFVVDVGSIYSHESRRYDHHMFNPPMDDNGHVFSSAGLIWYHYAQAYLRAINIPKLFSFKGYEINLRNAVEKIIKTRWVIPIDKWDNGVYLGPTPISEIVSSMLPIDPEKSKEKYDEMFLRCCNIVDEVFERACFHAADTSISKTVYIKSDKQKFCDNKILYVDTDVKEFGHFAGTEVHFVIFPVIDHTSGQTHYNIRPIYEPSSKVYKTSFPQSCFGLNESDLVDRAINGILFVHHTGFLAKAKSKDRAVQFCMGLL